jgi:hypothetical protein
MAQAATVIVVNQLLRTLQVLHDLELAGVADIHVSASRVSPVGLTCGG